MMQKALESGTSHAPVTPPSLSLFPSGDPARMLEVVALCGLPMHSEASPLAAGGRGGNGRSRSVPKTLLAHSESGIPGHVCPSAGFAASNRSVPDFIPV